MYPVKNIITKLNLTTLESTTTSIVVNNYAEQSIFMQQFKDCEDSDGLGLLLNDDLIGVDAQYDHVNNVLYLCTAIFNS